MIYVYVWEGGHTWYDSNGKIYKARGFGYNFEKEVFIDGDILVRENSIDVYRGIDGVIPKFEKVAYK